MDYQQFGDPEISKQCSK